MAEWEQRVHEEREQLQEKIGKLSAFIDSTEFESVPVQERVRLKTQLYRMTQYRDVMAERIKSNFGRPQIVSQGGGSPA